jgi:integrase
MSGGRPRTAIGTYGTIRVDRKGDKYVATTRFRDADGRLRAVTATGASSSVATAELKRRLLDRRGYGLESSLSSSSSFTELTDAWLEDLAEQDLVDGTKKNYRDDLRLHVLPAFEHLALGEITTGRVERFLKAESRVSYSRAKHSKNLLNLLFNFALRRGAIDRNPVQGTTPLTKPKKLHEPLTFEQIGIIRGAAASWRTGEGVRGPKPDGQLRDLIEVLLGTGMRIGEALALRRRDVQETSGGMVLSIRGTAIVDDAGKAIRQPHPKTRYSVRSIAAPEFVAMVVRARLEQVGDPESTIFVGRNGGPLNPGSVRRTFHAMLQSVGLAKAGITLHSFRTTVAVILVRGVGKEAAAMHLGHSSAAIVEEHYVGSSNHLLDFHDSQALERAFGKAH